MQKGVIYDVLEPGTGEVGTCMRGILHTTVGYRGIRRFGFGTRYGNCRHSSWSCSACQFQKITAACRRLGFLSH